MVIKQKVDLLSDLCNKEYMIPRWVLRASHGMLNLPEHLIHSLFCKGVRGFQTFVSFLFVLSLSLFLIRIVSLNYAILNSLIGILH